MTFFPGDIIPPPEWACPKWGGHEHDWLDCPECHAAYDIWIRSPEPDYERASGLCLCSICGKEYYDHPPHAVFKFLNVTCDGRIWKL